MNFLVSSKVDYLFSRRSQQRPKLTSQPLPPSSQPSKKSWGALTTYLSKLSPLPFFLAMGVHVHPVRLLATRVLRKILRKAYEFVICLQKRNYILVYDLTRISRRNACILSPVMCYELTEVIVCRTLEFSYNRRFVHKERELTSLSK